MGRRLLGPVVALSLGVAAAAYAAGGAGAQQPPPPTRPPGTLPPQTLPPQTQPPPTTRPAQGTLPPPTAPPIQTLPTAPATTAPDGRGGGGDGGSPLTFLAPAVLLGAVIVGGSLFVRGRARGSGTAAPVLAPPAPARTGFGGDATVSGGPGALTHELLEVSRQLTAASVTGDVKRATVRGALSLVPADGAALITVDATTSALALAVESAPDLLVPEHLGDGILGRVAETGDFVELISASEPAIRNRPASVLAMPLVAGGRVAAVLVVVRSKDQPFTPAETKTLRALAPMAAAVLQSERHAQSAIEDSLVDPLTGANNRRRFDRDLAAALPTAGAASPVSLAIVDLDHFKRVNDDHGHPAGDALLKAVVRTVQEAVRPGDGVYRFGGEEFCVLFAATAAAEAHDVAERVRAAIAARPFDVGAAEPLPVTASIGVATATADTDDPAALLARADAALYEAKEGGRNRVVAG
jgi:diguanylate cyclase (GGDEF)-like protein